MSVPYALHYEYANPAEPQPGPLRLSIGSEREIVKKLP